MESVVIFCHYQPIHTLFAAVARISDFVTSRCDVFNDIEIPQMDDLIRLVNAPQLWSGYDASVPGEIDYELQPIWSRLYDAELEDLLVGLEVDYLAHENGRVARQERYRVCQNHQEVQYLGRRTVDEEVGVIIIFYACYLNFLVHRPIIKLGCVCGSVYYRSFPWNSFLLVLHPSSSVQQHAISGRQNCISAVAAQLGV